MSDATKFPSFGESGFDLAGMYERRRLSSYGSGAGTTGERFGPINRFREFDGAFGIGRRGRGAGKIGSCPRRRLRARFGGVPPVRLRFHEDFGRRR